jgi:hypothetical protein
MLKELPDTIIPIAASWYWWTDGDWSPDNRLYVYERVEKYESGNIQSAPTLFDIETMKTESLEIKLDDGLQITRMYWLPIGK